MYKENLSIHLTCLDTTRKLMTVVYFFFERKVNTKRKNWFKTWRIWILFVDRKRIIQIAANTLSHYEAMRGNC